MPTQKPRISLTLEPHVEAAIRDLADAMGKPAATVVSQLLEEMVEQIQGLAKVARATTSGNRAAMKRALRDMVGDAVADLMTATQQELIPSKKRKS